MARTDYTAVAPERLEALFSFVHRRRDGVLRYDNPPHDVVESELVVAWFEAGIIDGIDAILTYEASMKKDNS
jgi:hypothetical protein